ncbi:MAG: hypothetical protein AAF360_06300 [Pseudomonadota bacterium]
MMMAQRLLLAKSLIEDFAQDCESQVDSASYASLYRLIDALAALEKQKYNAERQDRRHQAVVKRHILNMTASLEPHDVYPAARKSLQQRLALAG